MKCPACGTELVTQMASDIQVDLCQHGCGGLWLDDREIKKFDEEAEFDPETLRGQLSPSGSVTINTGVRPCPRCSGEILWKRWYDINRQVEVDQCPKCSGIWLDLGELSKIRGQYKTEVERQEAADKYLAPDAQQFIEDTQQNTEALAKLQEQALTSTSAVGRLLWRLFS